MQELVESSPFDYKEDPAIITLIKEKTNKLRKINLLITNNPQACYETDDCGLTAVHWAVKLGKLSYVSTFCLRLKNMIETKDNWGCTPLHYVVSTSNPSTIEILENLLESGANPYTLNNNQSSPIDLIFKRNPLSTSELTEFFSGMDNGQLKMTLISTLKLDILKVILIKYKNLAKNYTDHQGRNLLHLTLLGTDSQLFDVYLYLLSNGVDPHKKDFNGESATDLLKKLIANHKEKFNAENAQVRVNEIMITAPESLNSRPIQPMASQTFFFTPHQYLSIQNAADSRSNMIQNVLSLPPRQL